MNATTIPAPELTGQLWMPPTASWPTPPPG
jgi:hypothetical protein